MPPPRVSPPTPVVEMIPPVVARPCAPVASLKPPHVTPPPARAVRPVGVDRDRREAGQVGDQRAVGRAEAGDAVRAAADGQVDAGLARDAGRRRPRRRRSRTARPPPAGGRS